MLKIREIKALARENLLGRYGTVILAAFASVVLVLLSFAASAAALLYAMYAGAVIGAGGELFMPGVVIGAVLFTLFLFLGIILSFVVSIGNKRLLINICRGRRYGVGDIFYGLKSGAHPMRVIAVELICSFVIFLFTSGIRVVSGLASFMTRGGRAMSTLVMIGLLAVILILGLLAVYFSAAFMLADLIVIDEPGTGVFGSIRASMDLMKKKKLKAVWLLWFSFLFWGILGSICPPAMLWIVPYINCSCVIFYLAAREQLWQLPGSGLEKHAPYMMPADENEAPEAVQTDAANGAAPVEDEPEAPVETEMPAVSAEAEELTAEVAEELTAEEAEEPAEEVTEVTAPEEERFSGSWEETGLTGPEREET